MFVCLCLELLSSQDELIYHVLAQPQSKDAICLFLLEFTVMSTLVLNDCPNVKYHFVSSIISKLHVSLTVCSFVAIQTH